MNPGKKDCLILDFGGNVIRHGPVDAIKLADHRKGIEIAPAKKCPRCLELIHAGYAVCPQCGFAFPQREEAKHDATAAGDEIISGEEGPERREERVLEVSYHTHHKRNDDLAKPTMRVEYRCGFNQWVREWVCFEHQGYARQKAEQWWRKRSHEPTPDTVAEAVEWARAGALAPTKMVTVEKKPGDNWERIVAYELGDKPPRLEDPDNLPEPAFGFDGNDYDLETPF